MTAQPMSMIQTVIGHSEVAYHWLVHPHMHAVKVLIFCCQLASVTIIAQNYRE